MNDFEKAKESLNIILKKGDLYDAIALKKGVKSSKHNSIRTNLLLFSRILYGLFLGYEKIKSFFSPVQQVKEAQEQIRSMIGVKVDIVKSKKELEMISQTFDECLSALHPMLSILYENDNITIDNYIEDLKKIWNFASLHHIPKILLRKRDIIALSSTAVLDGVRFTDMRYVLNWEKVTLDKQENPQYDLNEELSTPLLELEPKDLMRLIRKLERFKMDKKTIFELGRTIEDMTIQKALNEFLKNGDLEKFKMIVNHRLSLVINSDSTFKNKHDGKVFQTVRIKDSFINVICTNSEGNLISNTTTTLYDYLEVLDYQELFNRTKMQSDEQEIFKITTLYLYLVQNTQRKVYRTEQQSFYDLIYQNFKNRRILKKISGLYTKKDKWMKSFNKSITSLMLMILLVTVPLGGIGLVDAVNQVFLKSDTLVLTTVCEYILTPYIQSFQYEKQLLEKVIDHASSIESEKHWIEKALDVIRSMETSLNFSNAKTGDVRTGEGIKKPSTAAEIIPINGEEIPIYFATGYANSGSYENGTVNYKTDIGYIYFDKMEDVEALFQVKYSITKESLESALINGSIYLKQLLYPVGQNYVITNIVITDRNNPIQPIEIYAENGKAYLNNGITLEEALNILRYMNSPEICCTYGISKDATNSFVLNMEKEHSYTETSKEKIRNSIIKGLGLNENATNEEAFTAIKNKLYSLTPLEDAGLHKVVKNMNETEFYETVASLDSLICNLAATLAVGVEEELVYTIGFYNNNDLFITEDEGHAWAMTQDGIIVDVTPSRVKQKTFENIFSTFTKKTEQNTSGSTAIDIKSISSTSNSASADEKVEEVISNLLNQTIKYHIPIVLTIALVGYYVKKHFGKQITFYIGVQKVKKTFMKPDFEETYAKLKQNVYGGINIPIKRNLIESIRTVEQEFSGFSLEELQALKQELQSSHLSRKELKTSFGLIDEIPFIQENSENIEKAIQKRKQL